MLIPHTKLEISEQHIWSIITHYLHKHKELCLSGLGRFAAQSNEFFVDPMAKKILPACKKIYFQGGSFEHTTEFLTFSAAVFNCSEFEIVHNLDRFILRFVSSLETKKRVEIENLGIFKLSDTNGEIDFESTQQDLFLDDTFGLKPIHFAANLLKTKRIILETPEEEEAALVEMRESALKELKVLLDNARISESNQPQKSSKAFPIIASILTLILIANLALFLYKGPVDGLKQQISQMNIAGNPSIIIDSQQTNLKQNIEEKEVSRGKMGESDITEAMDTLATRDKDETTKFGAIGEFMSRGYYEFDSTLYTQFEQVYSDLIKSDSLLDIQNTDDVLPKNDESDYSSPTSSINKESVQLGVNKYSKPISKETIQPKAQYKDLGKKEFYVIAGAFKIEENAHKYKEQLIQTGNKSAIVFKPSNYPYFLVSFTKNNSLEHAVDLLKSKEQNYPSIWIYSSN